MGAQGVALAKRKLPILLPEVVPGEANVTHNSERVGKVKVFKIESVLPSKPLLCIAYFLFSVCYVPL